MNKYHIPSCNENDKELFWYCNQCGTDEPATIIDAELIKKYDELKELLEAWYGAMPKAFKKQWPYLTKRTQIVLDIKQN